ncbi:YdiU family protein [Legionella qingyii]|uniref:Protein nucleotidyltransferase YdiU n=1 Tax=Legionella qingyii TaxID=2184757 RepID=A0A317U3L5_9GAMM|nr:YdiU family protein [Legionella qingyii]PWY55122.1 YdiU family protein [Legionella qingyii]RUR25455.1 YdiU family protein [Legionella qingyii]RUR28435.1 YdiU family protein [Legionella qingyii]
MDWLDLIPYIHRSSYLKLPSNFYEVIEPTPITDPYLVKFNHELASYLCAPHSSSAPEQDIISFYAGNTVPAHLKSIALAYAGHQFGYYVPLLGDGRAVLLGEIHCEDGTRWDIQLKGSGKTMFSRTGDGRAPLSAVLREYLISEAMHGLNIPTTRCLAAIASKEKIYRQNGPVPMGVVTRVASSSLRVGSFEYAAAQKDDQLLRSLANYALERHYPELLTSANPYLELFKKVVDRQAYLIAEWMGVGFIHGVMNTDNMTISGETIDYGPCAFMDEFDFGTVFSSIDLAGRYAFGNQASIAKWNLAQFSLALLPLFKNEKALQQMQEALNLFTERFSLYWNKKIREKLGLFDENVQPVELIKQFFGMLQQYKPDFTNTFRLLSHAIDCERYQNDLIKALGNQPNSKLWVSDWLNCIKQQKIEINEIKNKMNRVNPAYIPRNHLIENAIRDFVENNDSTLMDSLLSVLKNPFHQQEGTENLQCLPLPHERVHQTFCGT